MKIVVQEDTQQLATQLIDVVVQAFPDSTKTTVRSWIKHGRVTVDGRVEVKATTPLKPGSLVELLPKPRLRIGPLEVIYQDTDLVVVYKPSNLLSVASDYDEHENSVHSWLKHHYRGTLIYVIHRLDKETSGLMMFALNESAFHSLKEQLKLREVKRVYAAVVEGTLHGSGIWEDYLIEDSSTYVMRVTTSHQYHQGAQRAQTHWKTLIPGRRYSYLECSLNTGKKNQIRIQASHRGFPIAGDTKYGASFSLKEVHNKRICLHAKELSFVHPRTKKPMNFTCSEPEFFTSLVLHS